MPNRKKELEQYLLDERMLAQNTENRTPIILCVDTSYSMKVGRRLEKVVDGLEQFCRDMAKDPVASLSAELCIIGFGNSRAELLMNFTPPALVRLPEFVAGDETPLSDAVRLALQTLEQRKLRYDLNGIIFYRPWIIIIGDGDDTGPRSELDRMADLLKQESDAKHLTVLCITVGDENKLAASSLMRLSPDGKVRYLRDLKFREFFAWLSRSIEKTSHSMGHEEVMYESKTTWGEVLERRR